MARMIDQLRASKLPSNMMQFAARGALQVAAAENIEILVHLARHNKVFGDTARMTLAGWDEKSSLAVAADPQSPAEVLEYMISGDNVRPALLPALLENPSVPEQQIAKLAVSAMRDTIEAMLKSERVHKLGRVLEALRSNPYLKKEEAEALRKPAVSPAPASPAAPANQDPTPVLNAEAQPDVHHSDVKEGPEPPGPEDEEAVAAYLKEHAAAIAAEGDKPFQSIGGVVELLGESFFPVTQNAEVAQPAAPAPSATAREASKPQPALEAKKPVAERQNTMQKINSLDVKGRIQLALKGNKEERSILIRDGTKVVALAVLEAPKLADGEVEKFASQKNVLEAVLRQIPLKRRFMKNYIVVRNLVANPRTPIDLSLGLMKNLLAQDLKNISSNKEVSETIRKLALKMYKQKMDAANKK
jgi:hypothetical protein